MERVRIAVFLRVSGGLCYDLGVESGGRTMTGADQVAVSLSGEGVEFVASGPLGLAGGAAAMCLADYALMLEGGPSQIFAQPMPKGSVVLVELVPGAEPETMDVEIAGRSITFAVCDLLTAGAILGSAGTVH